MSKDPDQEVLERFIVEDSDLGELEARIAEFNLFEALGAVRQELRHSDFLSFLLNPSANHGMGDLFLRRFLMEVTRRAADPAVNPLEFDLIGMGDATVLREWQSVDILVHDSGHRIVCIIENKIRSGEHSGQLKRYLKITREHFGPRATLIPVFLTPEGVPPSDSEYIPLSYETVAVLVKSLVETQSSVLGADVKTLMQHYATMLRRHIVSDSKIAELCRRIYRRHQRAIDLILEHRPDLQQQIYEYLVSLIQREAALELDHSSKSSVRFALRAWDNLQPLKGGSGWTPSGRLLLFEFKNADTLSLALIIGPGPEATRQQLYELAKSKPKVFRERTSQLYPKWTTIWRVPVLSKKDVEQAAEGDVTPKIQDRWKRFLEEELKEFERLVSEAIG